MYGVFDTFELTSSQTVWVLTTQSHATTICKPVLYNTGGSLRTILLDLISLWLLPNIIYIKE